MSLRPLGRVRLRRWAVAEPANRPDRGLRGALRLGVVNGLLWSMGNGLTTGSLIVYLAQELGARGRQVGLILALQSLVGILRLATPALILPLGGLKSATIRLLSASYMLICLLPLVGLKVFPADSRLQFFTSVICAHQLLESLGTVALWAWLGRLVPARLRGRYFALRQRWQLMALIPTLAAAGFFVDWWRRPGHNFDTPEAALLGYMLPLGVGAVLLLSSILPLRRMPAVAAPARPPEAGLGRRVITFLAPLADGRFRRLVLFGCWLSAVNGIMQSAAGIYPRRVLGLGLLPMMLLPLGMRLGQIALAPWVGRLSDRVGNRPVILCCQALVSLGPMFFLLATPAEPWWLAGAFAVWSAYVGLNVCLPNLMLKLSRPSDYAAATAVYFALSGAAYGIATYFGGWLLDYFAFDTMYLGRFRLDNFRYLFYVGWVTRTLAIIVALGLKEPGAWTWRRIAAEGFRARAAAPAPSSAP